MADDFDGELISTSTDYNASLAFDIPTEAQLILSTNYNSEGNLNSPTSGELSFASTNFNSYGFVDLPFSGWYSQTDSLVVRVNHYLKRAWRTESNDYVEWESVTREGAYPGGGTLDPVIGTVIYQWVTVNGRVV